MLNFARKGRCNSGFYNISYKSMFLLAQRMGFTSHNPALP